MSKYKKSGTPKHSGHIIKASQQALAALFEKFLYFVERRYRRGRARARDCDSRSRRGNFQRAFCAESLEHGEEKAEKSVPRRCRVNDRHAEHFAVNAVFRVGYACVAVRHIRRRLRVAGIDITEIIAPYLRTYPLAVGVLIFCGRGRRKVLDEVAECRSLGSSNS